MGNSSVLACLFALVQGCTRAPPDPCAAYAESPTTLGWCRVEKAGEAATIEEARCEGLGELEEHCRVRWVQTHAEREQSELLAACSSEECRFVALDWKPLPFPRQMEACADLGMLANPCRVHAAARYFGGRPGLASQRRDMLALKEHHFVLGNQAGLARYCGIEVDCTLYGAYSGACDAVGMYGKMGGECSSFRITFPRP